MGHEQQRALEGVERLLELLDGRQVEVVGRLVEHEAVHALRGEAGEHRPGALAGRQRGGGPQHVLGAQPELGEQRARLRSEQPGRGEERVEQRARRRRTPPRAWSISPTTTPGPMYRSPDASGRRPSSARSSVVLPEPLGPTMATRSRPADLEVDRARAGTSPRSTTAPLEAQHHVAAAGARRRARSAGPSPPTASRPRRAASSALLGVLRLAAPASRCVRPGSRVAPCRCRAVSRFALRTPCTAHCRCVRARACKPVARVDVALVRAPRRDGARSRARRGSPASRRRTRCRVACARRARARGVTVLVEEGAVVAHDHDAAGQLVEELLEPRRARRSRGRWSARRAGTRRSGSAGSRRATRARPGRPTASRVGRSSARLRRARGRRTPRACGRRSRAAPDAR